MDWPRRSGSAPTQAPPTAATCGWGVSGRRDAVKRRRFQALRLCLSWSLGRSVAPAAWSFAARVPLAAGTLMSLAAGALEVLGAGLVLAVGRGASVGAGAAGPVGAGVASDGFGASAAAGGSRDRAEAGAGFRSGGPGGLRCRLGGGGAGVGRSFEDGSLAGAAGGGDWRPAGRLPTRAGWSGRASDTVSGFAA